MQTNDQISILEYPEKSIILSKTLSQRKDLKTLYISLNPTPYLVLLITMIGTLANNKHLHKEQ